MPAKRRSRLRYALEAAAVWLLFAVLRLLPLDAASAVGGTLARIVGPRTKAHKTALVNLALAFPEKTPEEHRCIALAMWDNLGRTAGEFPFLGTQILAQRMEVKGQEILEQIKRNGMGVAFVAAHFGNWELNAQVGHNAGLAFAAAYRPANNPWVETLITKRRVPLYAGLHPKGPKAALRLIRAAAAKQPVGMLVDQKMNDGIPVPFFGRDAMTAPAVAELALRYDVPVVPACVFRLRGAHFLATVFPPLEVRKSGNVEEDVRTLMMQVNAVIEGWVKDHPEQWFWVHDRWGAAKGAD